MGGPSRAVRVAWGAVGLAGLAAGGVGTAPGGVEGGPEVDLCDQIYPGGACRVHGTVGREEQKWEWECRSKGHIGGRGTDLR